MHARWWPMRVQQLPGIMVYAGGKVYVVHDKLEHEIADWQQLELFKFWATMSCLQHASVCKFIPKSEEIIMQAFSSACMLK